MMHIVLYCIVLCLISNLKNTFKLLNYFNELVKAHTKLDVIKVRMLRFPLKL